MSDMNRKAEEMANDAALLLWAGSRPPAYDELVTTIMHTILQFAEQYAQEKNRELVEALRPFANQVKYHPSPNWKDNDYVIADLTVKHFRVAAALLTQHSGKGGE